jgi:aspartate aminotransferase-like enzyme
MISYRIPLVPGPVSIPSHVLDAYQTDYGSSDLEEDFFRLYTDCERGLRQILATDNDIVIMSGEGMLALWSALKNAVLPGDRVLAVVTGVFGFGVADMARQIGAEVEIVAFDYDQTLDPEIVRDVAQEFEPHLISVIHCETPSGTLNPLAEVGQICREADALYYVDFVASAGGTEVLVDEWNIDLGLLGSQKVLSLMPDLSMVSVSERAWQRIGRTGYVGYDALLPWRSAVRDRYMPYTHNWHALAGLAASIESLLAEGLDDVYRRHRDVMEICHRRLDGMGVKIYPANREDASPTVTAAYVPDGWTWPRLDQALRDEGMVVGGSYGPLAGKVFRIGHMGSQADHQLVHRGMDVLEYVLKGA